MEKSATIGNLATALTLFQGKVPAIKKDAKNPYYKSKYASLGNIIDTIRVLLSECGLSYCQMPDGEDGLITILMHAESGEYLQSRYNLHAKVKDPQGMGSAITYARRYALSAILGLNTDDDDDANSAQGKDKTPEQIQAEVESAIADLIDVDSEEKMAKLGKQLSSYVLSDQRFRQAANAQMAHIKQELSKQTIDPIPQN